MVATGVVDEYATGVVDAYTEVDEEPQLKPMLWMLRVHAVLLALAVL